MSKQMPICAEFWLILRPRVTDQGSGDRSPRLSKDLHVPGCALTSVFAAAHWGFVDLSVSVNVVGLFDCEVIVGWVLILLLICGVGGSGRAVCTQSKVWPNSRGQEQETDPGAFFGGWRFRGSGLGGKLNENRFSLHHRLRGLRQLLTKDTLKINVKIRSNAIVVNKAFLLTFANGGSGSMGG